MLKKEIRSQRMAALKAKNVVAKEILGVVLGEIDTIEARHNNELDDAAVEKIMRKLVKSNRETMEASDGDAKSTLAAEIVVLEAFLPKTLDENEITAALADVADAIKAAGSDGQATGVAMKHLKSSGATVDGKTVSAAVKKIRA